jgi:hypothetical protein
LWSAWQMQGTCEAEADDFWRTWFDLQDARDCNWRRGRREPSALSDRRCQLPRRCVTGRNHTNLLHLVDGPSSGLAASRSRSGSACRTRMQQTGLPNPHEALCGPRQPEGPSQTTRGGGIGESGMFFTSDQRLTRTWRSLAQAPTLLWMTNTSWWCYGGFAPHLE